MNMSEPTLPDAPMPHAPSPSDIALRTLSALGTSSSEAVGDSSSFTDLLRAASRHCRRLVDAERVRIWVARRFGSRILVVWKTALRSNGLFLV